MTEPSSADTVPLPQRKRRRKVPRANFLGMWLRDPFAIGAIAASGPSLTRAMAAQVDPHGTRPVIELGPGSGAITRALLARGVAPERIIAVERNRTFLRIFRAHYPHIRVVEGDAANLGQLLAELGVTQVDAVVSGLPLLGMPRPVQRAILSDSAALMPQGGPFIQFTYGPSTPVPRQLLEELGLAPRRVGFALLNAPPASVWRFEAAAAPRT